MGVQPVQNSSNNFLYSSCESLYNLVGKVCAAVVGFFIELINNCLSSGKEMKERNVVEGRDPLRLGCLAPVSLKQDAIPPIDLDLDKVKAFLNGKIVKMLINKIRSSEPLQADRRQLKEDFIWLEDNVNSAD